MAHPTWRRVLTWSLFAVVCIAGAGGAVSMMLILLDYRATRAARDAEIELLTPLTARAQRDTEYAKRLNAEYARLTDASLQRESRQVELSWWLAGFAGLFVFGMKAYLVARGTQQTYVPPRRFASADTALPASGSEAVDAMDAGQTRTAEKPPVDLGAVVRIIDRHGHGKDAAVPILQDIQAHYRYLPDAALRHVCDKTDITPADIVGVATFYGQFRREPMGEHLVKVCHGTACHVAGAPRITDELHRHLHIPPGGDTDPQGKFTVEKVACLGCCTLAPVVQIDGETHGHLQPDDVLTTLERHAATAPRAARDDADHPGVSITNGASREIRIGLGSCCVANGSQRVLDALHDSLHERRIDARIKRVGCVGMCHQTPLLELVEKDRILARYVQVQPEHADRIVRRHFRPGIGLRRVSQSWRDLRHLLRSGNNGAGDAPLKASARGEMPVRAFLDPQVHIATEACGEIDPLDLQEYRRRGGFDALHRAASELDAQQIIEQVRSAGLRGRGGAGFPTASKWQAVRDAAGMHKYVICNGDEGDPGAFMDRMLMESYPYRVIEGVALAALATGAEEAIFYIRREYPLAAERVRTAIDRCEAAGLLEMGGDAPRRTLRMRVFEGAGAFVCGEESALIASIEGRRGMPTLRPPYPAQQGLFGLPTLVGNVETFAVVPWIMRHGPAAFARLGTGSSRGTKVFALTGKIRRGGLIEVPMGITVRRIVDEIGGGAPDTRGWKAVQVGGPSGGCLPAQLADTPIDYEALQAAGAMMGSGGLVVLDHADCMVDIARYFLSFTHDQSCGKCTPCRVGTRRMLDILERLCQGRANADNLQRLEELAGSVSSTSLCGLGKTAPNPVRTTLRYFRDEYEAHLAGRCPAGVCKALIAYEITDRCTGCTICAQLCPTEAIAPSPYERHIIDDERCTRCDACRVKCPEDAIRVVSPPRSGRVAARSETGTEAAPACHA